MSTDPDTITYVVGTVVPVVGAHRSGRLMVGQAGSGTIARVRIGAVVIGRVPARRSGREIRMGAGPRSVTYIVRTVVPVIRAGGAVQLIVGQAGSSPITSIRIGAVVIRLITASGARREIGMAAHSGRAVVEGTVVAVVRTGSPVS